MGLNVPRNTSLPSNRFYNTDAVEMATNPPELFISITSFHSRQQGLTRDRVVLNNSPFKPSHVVNFIAISSRISWEALRFRLSKSLIILLCAITITLLLYYYY